MTMPRWVMCGVIGAVIGLTGCATTDFRFEPVFQDREAPTWEPVRPLQTPEPPKPVAATENTVTFDRAGVAAIMATWEVADGNAAVLDHQNTALTHQHAEIAALIEAGKAREQQLELLRRAYNRQVWWTRAAWVMAGAVLVAQ